MLACKHIQNILIQWRNKNTSPIINPNCKFLSYIVYPKHDIVVYTRSFKLGKSIKSCLVNKLSLRSP